MSSKISSVMSITASIVEIVPINGFFRRSKISQSMQLSKPLWEAVKVLKWFLF